MPNIVIMILGLVIIDLVIIYVKYYGKSMMKEEIISWKVIGIIQIPILVIIYLFLFSFKIAYITLICTIIICIVLGLYLNYKGKKSATEEIIAEIIDINHISTRGNYGHINTMYTLTLKYIVNGVEYISKNAKGYSKLDENMVIGNKIMIKYNPKNPNDVNY